MSWRLVAVEALYSAVVDELTRAQSERKRCTIVVPDRTMRERVLRFLLASPGRSLIGVEIVTLNALIERFQLTIQKTPTEIALLKLRRWLRNLPDGHPLALLRIHNSGARTLLSAAEELLEADVKQVPAGIDEPLQSTAKTLLELRTFAESIGIGYRARRFREAARILAQSQPSDLDPIYSGNMIFAGFYDFAPSQIDYFVALVQFLKRNNLQLHFLLPTSRSDYAEYSRRMMPLLQHLFGDAASDSISSDRIVERLSGQPLATGCHTVVAGDEAGEIDALLRYSVKLAMVEGIPFHEQAIVLATTDPYLEVLREYSERVEVPLQFLEGESFLRTGIGRRSQLLWEWFADPERPETVGGMLRAIGCAMSTEQLNKILNESYLGKSTAIPDRLERLSKRMPLAEAQSILAVKGIFATDSLDRKIDLLLSASAKWWRRDDCQSPCEREALEIFTSTLLTSKSWIVEEPRLAFGEWLSLVRSALAKAQISNNNQPGGVLVGSIHALRGALFRVVLAPGGGIGISGVVDSPILPEILRTAWNRQHRFPIFGTGSDREDEASWLFAMAVAQGDRIVISRNRFQLGSGREQPESPHYSDFQKSIGEQEHTEIVERIDLLKSVALSQKEILISRCHSIAADCMIALPPSVPIPPLVAVDQWGNISPTEIGETEITRLRSVQSFEDFLSCPLRGFFRYLLPLQLVDRDDRYDRQVGSVVHKILENWRGEAAQADAADWEQCIAQALDQEHIPDAKRDPIERALIHRTVRTRLETWRKLCDEFTERPVGQEVEKEFARDKVAQQVVLDNATIHFRGRVDLVQTLMLDGDAKRLRIIDYKTGRLPPPKELTFSATRILQGPLYKLAAEAADWGSVDEVAWMYLNPHKPGNVRCSGIELQMLCEQASELLVGIVDGIRSGNFAPTPQPMPAHGMLKEECDRCPFATVCGERVLEPDAIDEARIASLTGIQFRLTASRKPVAEGTDE